MSGKADSVETMDIAPLQILGLDPKIGNILTLLGKCTPEAARGEWKLIAITPEGKWRLERVNLNHISPIPKPASQLSVQ
jgi:hypothetical protein